MLKKIILFLSPIFIMTQKHTFQDELKRQYQDYLKIFNKKNIWELIILTRLDLMIPNADK